MIKNPCSKDCPDRIVPTKDNLVTCHGHCKREAEYLALVRDQNKHIQSLGRQAEDVRSVWRGKSLKKR